VFPCLVTEKQQFFKSANPSIFGEEEQEFGA